MREPRLADTAFAGDQQITGFCNPAAGGELLEKNFVEPARRPVVDILNRGLAVTKFGGAQSGPVAPCATAGGLSIKQQRQPFGVGEITGRVLRLQLDEGFCHAVELQGSELFDGRVCQHRLSFPQWK